MSAIKTDKTMVAAKTTRSEIFCSISSQKNVKKLFNGAKKITKRQASRIIFEKMIKCKRISKDAKKSDFCFECFDEKRIYFKPKKEFFTEIGKKDTAEISMKKIFSNSNLLKSLLSSSDRSSLFDYIFSKDELKQKTVLGTVWQSSYDEGDRHCYGGNGIYILSFEFCGVEFETFFTHSDDLYDLMGI